MLIAKIMRDLNLMVFALPTSVLIGRSFYELEFVTPVILMKEHRVMESDVLRIVVVLEIKYWSVESVRNVKLTQGLKYRMALRKTACLISARSIKSWRRRVLAKLVIHISDQIYHKENVSRILVMPIIQSRKLMEPV